LDKTVKPTGFSLILLVTSLILFFFGFDCVNVYSEPSVTDSDLEIELVAEGLDFPTGIAFLGENDILAIEKNGGTVKRIVNNTVQPDPIIDVSVANKNERGLLGIAVINGQPKDEPKQVFLFYSESRDGQDGSDECPYVSDCEEDTNPVGNRLYKYDFIEGKLENPQLLLDLPPGPGSDHIGGTITVGPGNIIYIISGDGDSCFTDKCYGDSEESVVNSQTANLLDEDGPSGRGGILRVTAEGEPVLTEGNSTILGEEFPINLYYAYGIRNGFGMDFDPVTGKLWDAENGPTFGDEINLVEPGFNSGWSKFMGIWPITEDNAHPLGGRGYNYTLEEENDLDLDLVDFGGKGIYSEPEFIWNSTVGITALKFLNSDKLGDEYKNDMFVADYNHNNIYNFNLNENRTDLDLKEPLGDKIANSYEELENIIFADGFGAISDLEVGPDGYLYVVSFSEGSVYRITR
jgi:glucose/arabinose dehydrogenase